MEKRERNSQSSNIIRFRSIHSSIAAGLFFSFFSFFFLVDTVLFVLYICSNLLSIDTFFLTDIEVIPPWWRRGGIFVELLSLLTVSSSMHLWIYN